jgi:hypothetical protein
MVKLFKHIKRAWTNAKAEYARVRYGRQRGRKVITVRIDNLTEAQALAIEDLMATWVSLGSVGGSRWTSFYADGDGNFRPSVKVDGRKAQICTLTDPKARWKRVDGDETYMIDFDSFAWELNKNK